MSKAIVCTRPEEVQNLFQMYGQNLKVITLDDDIPPFFPTIQGSILLPPPSVLFNYVDYGDVNLFTTQYYEYLSTSFEVDQYIILLASVLLKGVNIAFFTFNSDPDMFIQQFVNYLISYYGIKIIPFAYSNMANENAILPQYIQPLLNKAVQYQYISPEEYNSFFRGYDESSLFKSFRYGGGIS